MESQRDYQVKYADQEFDIGVAVNLMKKAGLKVGRKGWNGKGMYLVYQKGYPDGIPINGNTAEATGIEAGTICKFAPYAMLKVAGKEVKFIPWNASQDDLFAEDWILISE